MNEYLLNNSLVIDTFCIFNFQRSERGRLSGATLGITDKMEARSPAPSPHSAGMDPGMKELGLVILTCLFLSSAELTEKEY